MKFFWIVLLYMVCSAVLLSGCASLAKLQVKGVDEVKLKGITEKKPEVHFNFKMYNPSPVGFKLVKMDLSLTINNTKITTLSSDKKVRMRRKSDVEIPMTLEPAWDDIAGIFKAGLKVFLTQHFSVGLTGEITVRKFIFKRTIPFNVSTDKLTF